MAWPNKVLILSQVQVRALQLLLSVVIIFGNESRAQQYHYPQDYFRSPIDSPIYLSGNFCTLRNDHFHYGIDITTYEKEGMPVLAAADGYVSRIKVWPYGYGKAIYIDHPNGYTTVCGHLSKFNNFIDQAVKDSQYDRQSFEMEFFPKPGEWKVKKGDLVAYSGNSGGSSGPHIHFEIRDTKTEEIINPLLFGLPVLDTIVPELRRIIVYEFENSKPISSAEFNADTVAADTILTWSRQIGFSAVINDYTTFKTIAFNPYKIEMFANGKSIYDCRFDRFSFDQQRMVNSYIDYERYWSTGTRFQKLFISEGNLLGFVKSQARGMISLGERETISIEIVATDWVGNSKRVAFFIKQDPSRRDSINEDKHIFEGNFTIDPEQAQYYSGDNFSFKTQVHSFFDSATLQIRSRSIGKIRSVQILSEKPLPLNKTCTLSIQAPPISDPKKLIIALEIRHKWTYVGGIYKNGLIEASINKTGVYGLVADITPPLIKATNINKKGLVKGSFINFTVTDNLSGISKYVGKIDGNWILMDYDAKNNWLTYIFDTNTPKGKHEFELIVSDKCDNKSYYKKTIDIP